MREEHQLLLPGLVALVAIVAFPTLFLFYVGFQKWILFEAESGFNGVDNFIAVLSSSDFHNSLRVSAIFTLASVGLTFILGLGLALLLNEEFRGRGLVRVLVALPLVIPPVVSGFSWKFLLNREVGLIGGYLLPLAGYGEAILGQPHTALLSVIIADVWSKTSLMFLILLAGLQAIPRDIYEAARIDGATSVRLFRHITLPMLRNAIIIALALRIIDAINAFDVIFVMTKGGPGTATQTLPMLGWKIGFQYYNMGQAAALAIIMIFLTIWVVSPILGRMRR